MADAANYILQGVLTSGTAAGRGIGRPAAGKTGTANGGFYAAFGGYTPTLAGLRVGLQPGPPDDHGTMVGNPGSCYREIPDGGGEDCPGQMFGDNAPAATWQMTFTARRPGPAAEFTPVPPGTPTSPRAPASTRPRRRRSPRAAMADRAAGMAAAAAVTAAAGGGHNGRRRATAEPGRAARRADIAAGVR